MLCLPGVVSIPWFEEGSFVIGFKLLLPNISLDKPIDLLNPSPEKYIDFGFYFKSMCKFCIIWCVRIHIYVFINLRLCSLYIIYNYIILLPFIVCNCLLSLIWMFPCHPSSLLHHTPSFIPLWNLSIDTQLFIPLSQFTLSSLYPSLLIATPLYPSYLEAANPDPCT